MCADGQVVWSGRPNAGVKPVEGASSQPGRLSQEIHTVTVAIEHRLTAESAKQPFKPSRGEAGMPSAEPAVHPACVLCTRDRGCQPAPGFPAPSVFEGASKQEQPRARRAAGT